MRLDNESSFTLVQEHDPHYFHLDVGYFFGDVVDERAQRSRFTNYSTLCVIGYCGILLNPEHITYRLLGSE